VLDNNIGGSRHLAAIPSSSEEMRQAMFDAQCDLAALVYDADQNPDAVLRGFADDLKARGFRAVGMVQAGQCADSSLSAVLVHSGETLLLAQDFDPSARGCRLDMHRLENAGARIAGALESGADLVIINRFGKREREGKGLSYLIERALNADIPVVIAVPHHRFIEWIRFVNGMSVKLTCDRRSLDAWWNRVSARNAGAFTTPHVTVCEVLK
jgi:nucleoside-triphosphatase THEP1